MQFQASEVIRMTVYFLKMFLHLGILPSPDMRAADALIQHPEHYTMLIGITLMCSCLLLNKILTEKAEIYTVLTLYVMITTFELLESLSGLNS